MKQTRGKRIKVITDPKKLAWLKMLIENAKQGVAGSVQEVSDKKPAHSAFGCRNLRGRMGRILKGEL